MTCDAAQRCLRSPAERASLFDLPRSLLRALSPALALLCMFTVGLSYQRFAFYTLVLLWP